MIPTEFMFVFMLVVVVMTAIVDASSHKVTVGRANASRSQTAPIRATRGVQ